MVRGNEEHRTDKRGAVIREGSVVRIRVPGRGKAWVVLRGNPKEELWIRMDDVTRTKLHVDSMETYDFEFKKAVLVGRLLWAWGASEIAYGMATRLGVLGVVLGIIGVGIGGWQIFHSLSASGVIPSHSLTVGDLFSLRDKYGDL